MISKYLKKENLSPQNVIEFGSLDGIKKAVLNNIGVGVGISVCINKEINNGDLYYYFSYSKQDKLVLEWFKNILVPIQ